MIEITAEIRAFIDKAAAGVELAEDEYIDLSDGLIHCKKCGGQRQTVVPCFGKSSNLHQKVYCINLLPLVQVFFQFPLSLNDLQR